MQSLRASFAFLRVSVSYRLWLLRCRPAASKGLVEVDDITIYYRSWGNGDPLILLHGGFASWEYWAGQIPSLSRHYRVIAMDSRGHGRTTLGTRKITYRQLARDTTALIERLNLGRVHLIGWSDGGCTGIALALQREEMLRSMVLLGTPFNTSNYSEEAVRRIDRFLRPTSFTLMSLRAMRRLVTPEPGSWKLFLSRMTEMWKELPDFTQDELGRINVPTLVFACDRDEFLSLGEDPLRVFRETAAAIPSSRMEVVPGGTHSVNMERPKVVNEIIIGFLERT